MLDAKLSVKLGASKVVTKDTKKYAIKVAKLGARIDENKGAK